MEPLSILALSTTQRQIAKYTHTNYTSRGLLLWPTANCVRWDNGFQRLSRHTSHLVPLATAACFIFSLPRLIALGRKHEESFVHETLHDLIVGRQLCRVSVGKAEATIDLRDVDRRSHARTRRECFLVEVLIQ